jgi:UDP-N-acetylmuramoyl-L-alanyl-D-glutamate--2,6-diaminopimelate ligase
MKIKRLLEALDVLDDYSGLDNFEVEGISCNSKLTGNNYIFVAIKGTHEDGNRFIDEAIRKGAKAIIVQSRGKLTSKSAEAAFIRVKDTRKALAELAANFYGNPSSKIKVIGITGTNGKTSISYLIESLLKSSGFHPAVIGTINYRFKDKIIISKNTTPGPVEIEYMLSDMLKEGIQYCLMEVSSHALDQKRVGGINFHSAIFTNLTQDHLDYHKTIKNYFKSKAELFKNMNRNSFVIINNDDEFGRKLKKLTEAKIITYGLKKPAQVTARNIKFDCRHTEFKLVSLRGEINLTTRLIGRHNVYNILASAAWAQEEGIDLSIVKQALEEFRLVPGRLERVDSDTNFLIFIDYAHTEDALQNVIMTLRQLYRKRIIVVFGCGGERDKTKRPKMGKVATELADEVIITSDNPRSEGPLEIIEDIKRGIKKANFCVIPERQEAIRRALSKAGSGDIVLVAGKGHETCQIIKDKSIHFDDRQVIEECLRLKNY